MYNIDFTNNNIINELEERLKKERNIKIYKRLQCLDFKKRGYNHGQISDILRVSLDTITTWIKLFKEQSFEGFCKLRYEGRRISKLEAHKKDIQEYVEKEMVQTLGTLQQWLEKKFELKVERSWLSRWLKKTQFFLQKDEVDSRKNTECRNPRGVC